MNKASIVVSEVGDAVLEWERPTDIEKALDVHPTGTGAGKGQELPAGFVEGITPRVRLLQLRVGFSEIRSHQPDPHQSVFLQL